MSRRSFAFYLSSAALVALLCMPATAYAERTLGLSNASFKFNVKSGQTVTGEVYVTNDGDESIKALVYAADQVISETGDVSYKVPSRGDLSSLDQPSTWTQMGMPKDSKSLGNLPYVELGPGDRVPVKFSFTVPPNVPAGDHNLVIFFELFDMPAGGELSTQVSGRIGARVALRVEGEVIERLEVRPFEVPRAVVGTRVPYSFIVNNDGNTNRRVTGTVELLDRTGNASAKATPLDASLVFAEASLEGSGALDAGSAMGMRTVRLEVVPVGDDGVPVKGEPSMVKELSVWVVPQWLVIAAGLLLVVLFALIVRSVTLRRARVRQQKARRAERARSRAAQADTSGDDTERIGRAGGD